MYSLSSIIITFGIVINIHIYLGYNVYTSNLTIHFKKIDVRRI